METLSLVTPISYRKISNLKFTDYILIFKDKEGKLKRAIPDFGEKFMEYSDSLILDALSADEVAVFRFVKRRASMYEENPMFDIVTNENGEIIRHSSFDEDNYSHLENFLLNSERRENVSKLLKKRNEYAKITL